MIYSPSVPRGPLNGKLAGWMEKVMVSAIGVTNIRSGEAMRTQAKANPHPGPLPSDGRRGIKIRLSAKRVSLEFE